MNKGSCFREDNVSFAIVLRHDIFYVSSVLLFMKYSKNSDLICEEEHQMPQCAEKGNE